MIGPLYRNELRSVFRDGRGIVLLVICALLALLSTWTSVSTGQQQEAAREAAGEAARAAWDHRHVDSAHSRAHYGDYVFRPSGALAKLDPGLQAVTGRVVFTEAHRQNDAVHRPQQDSASLLRYDSLEPSTLLQLLAPLLLLLVGFGVIASERESGRLRLLRLHGVRSGPLVLAKTLALWTLGVALCVVVVGLHVAFAGGVSELPRTLAFFGLHLVLLWVVAALVVGISSRVRRSGTAAALLLCLWVLGGIVLPRVAAMTATTVAPLPSRDAFQAAMQVDREKGLDGHDPRDARRVALEKEILTKYGVKSRRELPVSIGGLIMQADEDYGAKVWDKHFGALEERLEEQYQAAGVFSFVNPMQATDRLSMAIAGTGLTSHVEFLRQTEAYRRELVRKLNYEDAHGVKRSENGRMQRTTTGAFYKSFESFEYEPLALGALLGRRTPDALAMLAWLLGATVFLFASARRLDRQVVA